MNPDLNAQYTYRIFVSCSMNLIETIILFWYLYIFKCNGLNTIISFKLMLLNYFLGFNSWIIQQYQRHLTRQNSQNHIHHQYKERGWLSYVLVFAGLKSPNSDFSSTRSLQANKTPLTAGFSLACLKFRSRNEEAINSTRNETDLLAKCFLLPTLSTSILFTCFWIDLVRVLATTGNTSAVAGYTRV